MASGRVRLRFLEIFGEEQRYSERVRGRKSGAFDAEYFPLRLEGASEYASATDFIELLPQSLQGRDSFSAAEYGAESRLSGRRLYNTLNFFCNIGILAREKRDGKYEYFKC